MDLLAAVILGFIQGIVEWLPLSSKSQLMIAGVSAFGMTPAQAQSVALFAHGGTLLAAIVYFRNEIMRIIKSLLSRPKDLLEKNPSDEGILLARYGLVAVLMTGLVGVPLYLVSDHFLTGVFTEKTGLAFIAVIGAGLVITGILLLASHTGGARTIKESGVTVFDSVFVGLAQALSVLPGVSRSGTTTFALFARGYSAEDAFRLSFLLSIPTVLAAELFFFGVLKKLLAPEPDFLLVLTLSSFVFGYASLSTLLALAKKVNFGWMAVALGLLATIPFVLSLIGLITA